MNMEWFNKGKEWLHHELSKKYGFNITIEYGCEWPSNYNRLENASNMIITISGEEHKITELTTHDIETLGNPNETPETRQQILNKILQLINSSIDNL
jgi:hypothetical protein